MQKRTCCKCGESVPKLDTWIEIDPCTNKTVYVCDKCYGRAQNARVHVLMRVRFVERMCTLDILEIADHVYAYRVTYHLFDGYVQNESNIHEFPLQWIRDAFAAMGRMYDELNVHATETYMDCDVPCNQ